jgi:hypothetical protein
VAFAGVGSLLVRVKGEGADDEGKRADEEEGRESRNNERNYFLSLVKRLRAREQNDDGPKEKQ